MVQLVRLIENKNHDRKKALIYIYIDFEGEKKAATETPKKKKDMSQASFLPNTKAEKKGQLAKKKKSNRCYYPVFFFLLSTFLLLFNCCTRLVLRLL